MAKKEVEVSNKELVSCLRNERICIRHVPRQSHMVSDPKHILYGGMAEDAVKTFVVPKLSSGVYMNVLTKDEMAFLEEYLGMEKGALSVYKKTNNFWSDSNIQGVNKVRLKKQDNYLDLSIAEDYIRYKILLANKDFIAPSQKDLEDRPKATYQFVIVESDTDVSSAKRAMNTMRECYKEFGKIEDDKAALECVVEILEGKPVSPGTSVDFLQTRADAFIQANPKTFLKTVQDKGLPTKILIRKSLMAGTIYKKGDYYYLGSTNEPLCENNQEPVLSTAVSYLNNPKNQGIKFALEAQLNKE